MKLEQLGNVWVLSQDKKTLQLSDHEAMRFRTSNGAQRKGYLWKTVMPRLEGTRPDRKKLTEDEQRLRAWLDNKDTDWAGAYPIAIVQKAAPFVPATPAAPVTPAASAAPVVAPKPFVQPT
jgi:hypothetical protein